MAAGFVGPALTGKTAQARRRSGAKIERKRIILLPDGTWNLRPIKTLGEPAVSASFFIAARQAKAEPKSPRGFAIPDQQKPLLSNHIDRLGCYCEKQGL